MNHSIYGADRTTHLKIIIMALMIAIAGVSVALSSRSSTDHDAWIPGKRRKKPWPKRRPALNWDLPIFVYLLLSKTRFGRDLISPKSTALYRRMRWASFIVCTAAL